MARQGSGIRQPCREIAAIRFEMAEAASEILMGRQPIEHCLFHGVLKYQICPMISSPARVRMLYQGIVI